MTQGMSGLMSTCGPADGPPHRLPIAISDVAAGMFLAFGILAAIEARHRTDRQMVETSLLEAAVSFGVYEAAHYSAHGTRPARIGQAHRGSSPYQCLSAADGFLTIGASQQNFWERFTSIIGRPELRDDARFKSNADRVAQQHGARRHHRERTSQEAEGAMARGAREGGYPLRSGAALRRGLHRPAYRGTRDVCCHRAFARGDIQDDRCSGEAFRDAGSVHRAAPTLGQHTEEILGAPTTSLNRSR